MRSDLTGAELDGGPDPVLIKVRLPDGTRRQLQVGAGEAAALAAAGHALADDGGGLRTARQGLKWLAVLVVGSLAVPSATKQWSDRSEELATKAAIVTKTSESTATTINTIRYIIGDVLPVASARKAAADALADAKAAREAGLRATVRRAASTERKVELATYNTLKNDWGKTAAVVESQLQSYFPLSGLPEQWHEYSKAVTHYLRVGSALCGDQRRNVVDALEGYRLASLMNDLERSDLLLLQGGDCTVKGVKFQASYFLVGERLLDEEARLVREIVRSNASGYSSGWSDFWRDIVPG